ncbi:MAG TPA: hypothetical protein VM912_07980 [Terriglobales bacterium]|nr:hypothetical protein [Terriglobales bacterium]
MEKTSTAIANPDRILGNHETAGALVQQTLAEICQSAPFRASRQSRDLLRYIVDQSLAGHTELLKERLIGVNVFGRRPDYDTNEDPIVRARAGEVRKRLAQFYQGQGRNSLLRIELSPGSYLASFTEPIEEDPAPALPLTSAAVESSKVGVFAGAAASDLRDRAPLRVGFRTWFLVLAVVTVSLVGAVWIQVRSISPSMLSGNPCFRARIPCFSILVRTRFTC